MSAAESSTPTTMVQLHERFSGLYRQEVEICRQMAGLIISESGGAAADIRDFYIALYGRHGGGFDHFAQFEFLANKVVAQSAPDEVVLIDNGHIREETIGIVSPELVIPETDKPYRLHIEASSSTVNRPGEPPMEYDGTISIPLLAIESRSAYMRDKPDYFLADQAKWEDLATIHARAHHSFTTNLGHFVEAKDVHFGFENALKAASPLGTKALEKLVFYHELVTAEDPEKVEA